MSFELVFLLSLFLAVEKSSSCTIFAHTCIQLFKLQSPVHIPILDQNILLHTGSYKTRTSSLIGFIPASAQPSQSPKTESANNKKVFEPVGENDRPTTRLCATD